MSGDASVSTQHREACLACLLDGLKSIGIRGDVNAAIDFSAIGNAGNYSLVDSFAHAIEACLDGKGYIVASLVDGFRSLHDKGNVVNINDAVTSLVAISSRKTGALL